MSIAFGPGTSQGRPRILFVSNVFPHSLREATLGGFKRVRMFLDAFSEIGDLQMLFYVPDDISTTPESVEAYTADIARYWNLNVSLRLCPLGPPVHPIFNSKFFRGPFGRRTEGPEQVGALTEMIATEPSAIMIHRLNSAHTLLQVKKPDIPIFFDIDDVEHLAFFRNLRQPPKLRSKPLMYLQIPAIMHLERRIAAIADATFVCSDRDAKHLTSVLRLRRVIAVPNAVEIPDVTRDSPTNTIVFVGNLCYDPNTVAVDYLVDEVWPRIRALRPDTTLVIVGTGAECTRAYRQHVDGVQFLGFVPDIAKIYASANLVCCPVWSGGGTRVKIIEAAAYGVAIVSTTFGAQGLAFENEKEILLRDTAESIAAACIQLLTDSALRTRLGSAARDKVAQLYDRRSAVARIRAIVEPAVMREQQR